MAAAQLVSGYHCWWRRHWTVRERLLRQMEGRIGAEAEPLRRCAGRHPTAVAGEAREAATEVRHRAREACGAAAEACASGRRGDTHMQGGSGHTHGPLGTAPAGRTTLRKQGTRRQERDRPHSQRQQGTDPVTHIPRVSCLGTQQHDGRRTKRNEPTLNIPTTRINERASILGSLMLLRDICHPFLIQRTGTTEGKIRRLRASPTAYPYFR
jgi:hypothetical protein